jgi:hypothetical protein
MEEQREIAVSPYHRIRLAGEYLSLIDRAPARDFVVHVIEHRQANGLPLMSAEIVIASERARAEFALARTYPLHFRKTYFAARMHGDPQLDFELATRASELAALPPPIGASRNEVRSCFIPGRPYRALSLFQGQTEDDDLRRARAATLPLEAAAGLWRLLEDAHQLVSGLHAGGLSHGDPQLQNFIVSRTPLSVVLVDFEAAMLRDSAGDAIWAQRCASDLRPLWHEAALLQAHMGRQRGPLAEQALTRASELFKDPARVLRYVDQLEELSELS